MFADRRIVSLLGAALLTVPLYAMAEAGWYGDWKDWSSRQSDGYWSNQYREPQSRLVEKYDGFAGSEQNARSLVDGLRHDTRIQLSSKGDSASFTSPTKPMGYGNVNIALALAKASLADAGIRHPAPDEIKAALVGGTVTDKSGSEVKLAGVLSLRASGLGWGEIAHKLGFKLGDLMRAHKVDRRETRRDHKDRHERDHERVAKSQHEREHGDAKHRERDEGFNKATFHKRHDLARVEKLERVHRPEHFERPHRPEKVERVERPEKVERAERPERPERAGGRGRG